MSDSPAVLTDVSIQGEFLRQSPLIALTVGVVTVAIFAVFLVGPGGTATAPQEIIAAVIGGAATVLLITLQRRRTVRKSRQEVQHALNEPLEQIARAAIRRRGGMSGSECVRAMVETLAQGGRVGATFRICTDDAADPVEPTPYPFEPRPLEHAHVNQERGALSSQLAYDEESPSSASSAIRRNIKLKGGWFVVVMFGIAVLNYARLAIVQRRLSWMLFCWIALFLAMLLIPARAKRWRARMSQCLLVPGGIVFRKSAWRSEKWDLHVFDRRESVLCVYRHWRRQWIVTVADKHACETAIGTREEIHFLLRAWLSPLEPPTVEMLSDLT